ncbi:hypothetical protein TrST_g8289 [Triparma strigata]|uniref:DNA-directed RNA polymerase subunit n=1 Tax=Triparma strigata TaxID=1606541 RepID=A0A9W7DV04_9STRA|nr:hypothetical protein TrST_g8289 [Triparma strigata]
MPSNPPIRSTIQSLQFSIYTDDETRSLSTCELTSPLAYDNLGTPLPGGCYDPRLGPTSIQDGNCVTCGKGFQECPGHVAHVELCVPVYSPLLFGDMTRLLKAKCLACHRYKAGRFREYVTATKLFLLEKGAYSTAMGLDDALAGMLKKIREKDFSSKSSTPDKTSTTAKHLSSSSLYTYMDSVRASVANKPDVKLTSHERSVYRSVLSFFMKSNGGASAKCQHCSAFSPKIRADASNKFFLRKLTPKQAQNNNSKKIKIDAAINVAVGEIAPDYDSSSDSDDSDSDNTSPTSSTSPATKPDQFMTSLEIQAQVKLTWEKTSYLSSRIFGTAHCEGKNTGKGWTMFFMRTVCVPPSRFRPPMVLGNMTVEHSQNLYINKIIEINSKIASNMAQTGALKDSSDEQSLIDTKSSDTLRLWIDLQLNVNCYIDSSKDPNAAQGNSPPGIRQLLERKEGIFRKHMMGKRVNFACRSVISPDPYIGTNEIGIPLKFAKTLNFSTPVTAFNVEKMRELVSRGPENYPGACWVEEANGRRYDLGKMSEVKREAIAARLISDEGQMKVGRQLENGDTMLVNRQPTLHKPGIMAHHVRVLHSPTQQTIRMHYANCNTYNADFDGDEMNCHFPQSDLARAEAEHIASNDLQYIVPTDGSPLRGLIQDHVDGGVKLCGKNSFLEREEYFQLVYSSMATLPGLEVLDHSEDIQFLPPTILKPRELWTGKDVISTLLQNLRRSTYKDASETGILPGISMERKAKTPATAFGDSMKEHLVLIRDGYLLRGVLDKAAFGATEFSLVHAVHEAYGPHKAGLLLNSLGRLFTAYIQYYAGHSCRMEDLILKKEADEERRNLITQSYNKGMRAAAAWADSDGGKTAINDENLDNTPLKPYEHAAAAKKIHTLLSGSEGPSNAAALDSYMQGKLNPLASKNIKACLPDGLAVPFPDNTFSLMCSTGAKGSVVNQSQVSVGLGQQALEGRRVPRMSSGRTLPSFKPYDPNPRADGFITDRFLTGIRPQEYYFHCMSGREGLVDTAVKTSRSGYLQRCLVKHLEELTVQYDNTVRDAEGNVIQFLYGEDGIDPTKAAHLDCSSATLQFMARNSEALDKRYAKIKDPTLSKAVMDSENALMSADKKEFTKGEEVLAKKLRVGTDFSAESPDLCDGYFPATVKKVSSGTVSVYYADDKKKKTVKVPMRFMKKLVKDPILNDGGRKSHRLGVSGACVSERVATKTRSALREDDDQALKDALKSSKLTEEEFESIVARKYADALVAPGEAVGSIAAQSVGEPSTQMTLNTFHLAGHGGANVTLGIPRIREIIMTASRVLKTPLMSIPFNKNVDDKVQEKFARSYTKLSLREVLHHNGGVTVNEKLTQGVGEWKREYQVVLRLQSEERVKEAFGLGYDEIATAVARKFLARLGYLMKSELNRAKIHDGETGDVGVLIPASKTVGGLKKKKGGGDDDEGNNSDEEKKNEEKEAKKKAKKKKQDEEEYENEEVTEEDGVMGSRFGHRKEMATYDDDGSEDEEGADGGSADESNDDGVKEFEDSQVTIDRRRGVLILSAIEVDVSSRPLLMVGLAERAAESVVIRSRPSIERGMVVEQEGRGKCLQTEGVNFEELWKMSPDKVDHTRITSNDIWAIRCAYGVEAARLSIVNEIRGVFGVYGISVDARHLTLIADYMTFDGDYKPMNRRGMIDGSSAFLKMSFETTATFMTDAAVRCEKESLMSPSANIVLGNPVKQGTGLCDLIVAV